MKSVCIGLVGAVLLSGCGGGGGGDDAAPPAPSPTGPSISADVSSVSLTKSVAETADAVIVTITVADRPSTQLFAGIVFDGAAVVDATLTPTGAMTAEVRVSFPAPGSVTPGVLRGSVSASICLDNQCAQHVRGSPLRIPVELTVTGMPALSATVNPSSISATAMRDLDPSPAIPFSVSFSAPVVGTPQVVLSNSGGFIAGSTNSMTSPTKLDGMVYLTQPSSMPLGISTDTLTVNICYASNCVNRVTAAPIQIPVSYTVQAYGPRPEPGVPTFTPTRVNPLPHNVIDAEYSQALDAIVTVASYPRNALYVYDVNQRTERELALNKLPTAVSIAPNGLNAAVGHDALITYVDLSKVGVAGAPAPKVLNVSTNVYDIVADGRGRVHAFPLEDQWVNLHTVTVATNAESIGVGVFYDSEHARLHPSGDYIYGANNGISPGDLEKFDIRTLPTQRLYDSPYHGTYEPCGNLWFDESGASIYTACANVFRTSLNQASDMVYAGALQRSQAQSPYWVPVTSVTQSAEAHEIVMLELEITYCVNTFDLARCYTRLSLHDSEFLQRQALYSIGPMSVAGSSYVQLGQFVFHRADGGRRFLVSRLHAIPNPAAEFYISEF